MAADQTLQYKAVLCDNNTYGVANRTYGLQSTPCKVSSSRSAWRQSSGFSQLLACSTGRLHHATSASVAVALFARCKQISHLSSATD